MSERMEQKGCGQAGGFSLGEKLFAQATFNAGALIGAYGIWFSSPVFAVAYLIYVYGSFTLLMRYTICARCPHLLEAGDCLFLPPALAKRIVSATNTGPLRLWERVIFFGAFLGTVSLPVWFLLKTPALLAAFIAAIGANYLGLRVHFCKECHTIVCPLNRNQAAG